MATTVTVLGKTQPLLPIPEDFTRITSKPRSRIGEAVRVDRYQHQQPVQWFGSRETLVWGDDDRLLSFNDFTGSAALHAHAAARQIVMQVWQALNRAMRRAWTTYASITSPAISKLTPSALTFQFGGSNSPTAMSAITGSQWRLVAKRSKWSANPCGIIGAAGAGPKSETMTTGCGARWGEQPAAPAALT